MNRSTLPAILADLDDCISRLRDAGAPVLELQKARDRLEPAWEPERPSYPPNNGQVRRTASEHFARARQHTAEAIRRLRRDS